MEAIPTKFMGLKRLFVGLFAAMSLNVPAYKRRQLGNMNLSAGERFGRPVRGWRKTQSVARHRENQQVNGGTVEKFRHEFH